jgi:hypothetical protein
MKPPIFKEAQRRYSPSIELAIAKLRFRREIERTPLVRYLKKIAEWLSAYIKIVRQ